MNDHNDSDREPTGSDVPLSAIASLPRHPVPRSFSVDVLGRLGQEDTDSVATRRTTYGWLLPAASLLLGFLLATFYAESRVRSLEGLSDQLSQLEMQVVGRDEIESILATRGAGHEAHLDQLEKLLEESRELAETDRESRLEWRAKVDEQVQKLARELATNATRIENHEVGLEKKLAQLDTAIEALNGRTDELLAERERSKDEPALAESDASDEPARRPERVAALEPLHMKENGRFLSLEVSWKHPDAIPALFRLYESGSPDWSSLAFSRLEQRFSNAGARAYVEKRLAEERRRNRPGLLEGILGTRAAAASPSASRDLTVELYKEYWLNTRDESKSQNNQ